VKALRSKSKHGAARGASTGIVLQEDLSPAELGRKRELMPVAKQLRADGRAVDFRRDQLVVLETPEGASRGRWVLYKAPASAPAPAAAAPSTVTSAPSSAAAPAAAASGRVLRSSASQP
jgi:hypothetical protein